MCPLTSKQRLLMYTMYFCVCLGSTSLFWGHRNGHWQQTTTLEEKVSDIKSPMVMIKTVGYTIIRDTGCVLLKVYYMLVGY